jgi:pimeloyl-ACP methyl ester carboxylesterase
MRIIKKKNSDDYSLETNYMTDKFRSNTVVFIHGLFMNPESWADWKKFYQEKGFACFTPAYPFHEGNPDFLRKNINPDLGKLTFMQVIDKLSEYIDSLPESPILIGHSMGGLAVQKLIGLNKGAAGICIDPAPPSGMFSFKWSFLKANISTVNPFKGNSPFLPDVKWFHYAFCNTMTLEQTETEYNKYVVPESRNIARSSTMKDGKVDFRKLEKPVLIIAGEKDNIVPSSLILKNYKACKEKNSRTEYREFADRTHFICAQPGWEEVANFTHEWILKQR